MDGKRFWDRKRVGVLREATRTMALQKEGVSKGRIATRTGQFRNLLPGIKGKPIETKKEMEVAGQV